MVSPLTAITERRRTEGRRLLLACGPSCRAQTRLRSDVQPEPVVYFSITPLPSSSPSTYCSLLPSDHSPPHPSQRHIVELH